MIAGVQSIRENYKFNSQQYAKYNRYAGFAGIGGFLVFFLLIALPNRLPNLAVGFWGIALLFLLLIDVVLTLFLVKHFDNKAKEFDINEKGRIILPLINLADCIKDFSEAAANYNALENAKTKTNELIDLLDPSLKRVEGSFKARGYVFDDKLKSLLVTIRTFLKNHVNKELEGKREDARLLQLYENIYTVSKYLHEENFSKADEFIKRHYDIKLTSTRFSWLKTKSEIIIWACSGFVSLIIIGAFLTIFEFITGVDYKQPPPWWIIATGVIAWFPFVNGIKRILQSLYERVIIKGKVKT